MVNYSVARQSRQLLGRKFGVGVLSLGLMALSPKAQEELADPAGVPAAGVPAAGVSVRERVPAEAGTTVARPPNQSVNTVTPKQLLQILDDLKARVTAFRKDIEPFVKIDDVNVGWDRKYRHLVMTHLDWMRGYAQVVDEIVRNKSWPRKSQPVYSPAYRGAISGADPRVAYARMQILRKHFQLATNISEVVLHIDESWGTTPAILENVPGAIRGSLKFVEGARKFENELQRDFGYKKSADQAPELYPRLIRAHFIDHDARELLQFLDEPIARFKRFTVDQNLSDRETSPF